MSPVMVKAGNTAKTTAYIIDPPQVSVILGRNKDVLNCSWKVRDIDPEEKITAEVQWFKNGVHIEELDENLRLEPNIEYYKDGPEANFGEKWECKVKAVDKFDSKGESFSVYSSPSGMSGYFFFDNDELNKKIGESKDRIVEKIKQTITDFLKTLISKVGNILKDFKPKSPK